MWGFWTQRRTDYSQWYLDVIAASEVAENSPVKGCMVIRPWGMSIWDEIREELNRRIKATGAQNAYFPVMIPLANLSKEAGHVDGFAKECAVVTHHRLVADPNGNGLIPDPAAKLEEPLVIRPTSEAMIWDMFRKWIQSHRDLPMKLNQWANVVRWEMRTRPFLRTSEFLWQEGHTAHATRECAMSTTVEMIDMYADFVSEMLAMPVVRGVKSPSERFAGADETYTIEALMQNGWALQAGTSHFLGQNFGRAFGVEYQTSDMVPETVWATSWGVSTRLMGALIMTHADDKGLILPPRVAPVQVPQPQARNHKPPKSDFTILVPRPLARKILARAAPIRVSKPLIPKKKAPPEQRARTRRPWVLNSTRPIQVVLTRYARSRWFLCPSERESRPKLMSLLPRAARE